MTENDRLAVVSTVTFTRLRLIDGGDTVAFEFKAPSGRDVTVLVPHEAASALQTALAATLAQSDRRKPGGGDEV